MIYKVINGEMSIAEYGRLKGYKSQNGAYQELVRELIAEVRKLTKKYEKNKI